MNTFLFSFMKCREKIWTTHFHLSTFVLFYYFFCKLKCSSGLPNKAFFLHILYMYWGICVFGNKITLLTYILFLQYVCARILSVIFKDDISLRVMAKNRYAPLPILLEFTNVYKGATGFISEV